MERKYYFELENKEFSKITIVRMLKKHGIFDFKSYYDSHYILEGEGKCKYCGKETKFLKFRYYDFCNTKCAANFNDNVSKSRERIGSNIFSELSVAARIAAGNTKTANIKRMDTVAKNNNCTYNEHISNTQLKFNANLTPEEKFIRNENLNTKRGTAWLYKSKDYVLNNINVKVQGYEPIVLDILKKYYQENNITVQNKYLYYDFEYNKRRYYPDIILKNENILIEVKSTYTFSLQKEITVAKMLGSRNNLYKPILIILNKKFDLEMFEKDLIETISSQDTVQCVRFNDYPFIGVGDKQMISEALDIYDKKYR